MLRPLIAPGPLWVSIALLTLAVALRLLWVDQVKMVGDESEHYYLEVVRYRLGAVTFGDLASELRVHFSNPIHAPGSGVQSAHPLLPVLLMGVGEALVPNGTGARLVNCMFGLATAGMLFVIVRESRGLTPAIFALGLGGLMPLALRYNRTLYLDSIFAFGWTLLVFFLLRMSVSPGLRGALGAGAASALVISSKISGPLALPFMVIGMFVGRAHGVSFARGARFAVLALLSAGILGILLNDPVAYLKSIEYPVDSDYQNRTIANWLWYLTQPVSLRYIFGAAAFLISPLVVLLAIAGTVTALVRWNSAPTVDRIAVIGLVAAAPILPLHLPGISAEHGYLAFLPFVVLLATRGVYSVVAPKRRVIVATIVILTMLPLTVIYGLRISPLPYPSYLNAVDFGQQFYDFDRQPLHQR